MPLLGKIEPGKEFDNIPTMTVWLSFRIPTYREKVGRNNKGAVNTSEIFRILKI